MVAAATKAAGFFISDPIRVLLFEMRFHAGFAELVPVDLEIAVVALGGGFLSVRQPVRHRIVVVPTGTFGARERCFFNHATHFRIWVPNRVRVFQLKYLNYRPGGCVHNTRLYRRSKSGRN
jgi:hypothetical protein